MYRALIIIVLTLWTGDCYMKQSEWPEAVIEADTRDIKATVLGLLCGSGLYQGNC